MLPGLVGDWDFDAAVSDNKTDPAGLVRSSGEILLSGDNNFWLSLGDGEVALSPITSFPCFSENTFTALMGPCLVVDGEPFRLTLCGTWFDISHQIF